jgi:hypothetical protein
MQKNHVCGLLNYHDQRNVIRHGPEYFEIALRTKGEVLAKRQVSHSIKTLEYRQCTYAFVQVAIGSYTTARQGR